MRRTHADQMTPALSDTSAARASVVANASGASRRDLQNLSLLATREVRCFKGEVPPGGVAFPGARAARRSKRLCVRLRGGAGGARLAHARRAGGREAGGTDLATMKI